jgi:hypothetical protein
MPQPKAYPISWGTGDELKKNIKISEQPEQLEKFDDANYESTTLDDGTQGYKHTASGALYTPYGQKLGGRRKKSSRRKSKRAKSYRKKGGRRRRTRKYR